MWYNDNVQTTAPSGAEKDWKRTGRGAHESIERTGKTVTREEKKELEIAACKIRMGIIEGTHGAKSGHPGGSLSAADAFAYLYFKELNIDPENPAWPERDRFVLSKGHTAPGLYATLALRGYFPVSELKNLRHIGSMLQGHPNMNDTPGVDMSTGSLGQGVSAAAGMALAAKHKGSKVRVYTLLGDGEIEEGEVWEAFMFAAHYALDNLTVIIDNNGLQIDGPIDKVMSSYPIDKKLEAFGFDVFKAGGNDMDELDSVFAAARACAKPACILMKTVKGKGVSFMENQVGWHGKAPNDEEYETAMAELRAQLGRLEAE